MLDPADTKNRLVDGFLLGEYLVEPELQRISKNGIDTPVEPRVMDVLVCLAENAGRTVTKDRFMDEVWDGTVVSDDALLRCISELRKIFNDDPRTPAYIESIRKKGYRLIAPVVPVETSIGAAPPSNFAPRETPWPLVWAVLSLTAILMVVAVALLWPDSDPQVVRPVRTLPLTSYPGEEADPNISPDGMRVAFVWDGGTGGDRNIYVKQIGVASP
ncbi:MAG: winged helix-turn-helix domain-containing protein, partial [Rhodothermales bacterium]